MKNEGTIILNALAMRHNQQVFDQAADTIEKFIGDGFYVWVNLPNGDQIVLPKGSEIKSCEVRFFKEVK